MSFGMGLASWELRLSGGIFWPINGRCIMGLYAMEVIDYQNGDDFGDRLSLLVEQIYAGIEAGTYKSNDDLFKTDVPKQLEKMIKDRFGLNIKMDTKLHHYLPAAIIPFSSDYLAGVSTASEFVNSHFEKMFGATNIFRHVKGIEKERQDYYKRIHNRTGYFNRKHAKVGGYLADVRHYLIINFFSLKDYKLTPKEVAGVVMHEIGHALSGLVGHYKLMTNNSAITEVLNELNKNNTEKALYVFKRHFGAEDIVAADLSSDSPIVDFYPLLAKQYLGTLESQMLNGKYDQTNFENLADTFATKFNLGKELVTGLQKIHLEHGSVIEDSRIRYFISYAVQAISIAFCMVMFGVFGLAFFTIVILFFSGTAKTNMTYDIPVDRYNRIRNTIIANLSNPNLPKEFAKDLLVQIEAIDTIIKKTDNIPSVSDLVADLILPSNREAKHYIEVQQTIENNLNTILFVKSAQLRHS